MARPPLDGVRILAVSQFGAGPFGTQVLADLGADIIKVEDPGVGGDSARYVPPFQGEADSPYFQSFNRGKRSVSLNLRHPDGQAVFRDLVRVSDAVFNNARGDLPDKLGLTYEALRDANPRIVCCSLTGYGRTGPRAGEPAFDYLVQGYAGYMSVTGEPDGPPGKCGVSVIDFAGGYAGMVGLMVGLFDAQRTGIGRDVDVSLLDTAVSMLSYFAIWTLNRDWTAERTRDSAHQTLVPAQNFPTRDGWIVVFCNKDKFWRDLVETLGVPELGRGRALRHLRGPLRPPRDAAAAPARAIRDPYHRGLARSPPRARAVRAGERRAPGPGRPAGAGPGHDRRGRAPRVRDPARGAEPGAHRGRDPAAAARPAAGRAHRLDPARRAGLRRRHDRPPPLGRSHRITATWG